MALRTVSPQIRFGEFQFSISKDELSLPSSVFQIQRISRTQGGRDRYFLFVIRTRSSPGSVILV